MKIRGADISMLNEVENSAAKYYIDNQEQDLLSILSIENFNLIRLRLWVNPYDEEGNPYGGGTNDLETTLKLAKRIKSAKMAFMLDIHYSDFWTDPRKQTKPKQWEQLSFEQLKAQVYNYTSEVLKCFADNDCIPEYVQVGNEITNGFLWPEGQLPEYINNQPQPIERNYTKFFELLENGIKAVRDMSKSKIILHVDFGGDNGLFREWFDSARKHQIDYDIIGVSYYPFWHNNLKHLESNLNDISQRYNKEIIVVETSYPHTTKPFRNGQSILNDELIKTGGYPATIEGQKRFILDLQRIIEAVPNSRGLGYVYWEPAWIPSDTTWATIDGQRYAGDFAPEGNSWADQAIFDYNGNLI